MSFGQEQWLWALALPALILIVSIVRRRQQSRALGLKKAKYANASFRSVRETAQGVGSPIKVFLSLALALSILALARPYWGSSLQITFERSREVIIAIDLSKSMLAEDIKPNRLERAKLVVDSMLDSLKGESVGLVVFAGTAFLQSPMSPDYQILRGFLRDLKPSFIPQGGTNYRAMIDTALKSFKQSDGMADRFLIVISDGESQGDSWKDRIKALEQENVQAVCIGFGTSAGAFIPDGSGGYHKDAQGAVVLSKLEPKTLQELAELTGGLYREANVWIDLAALVEETVKKGRASLKERERETLQVERYQYFLVPAFAFLMISIFREFPALPKARNLKRRGASS